MIAADGHSLAYVSAVLTDAEGNIVPDEDILLKASVSGNGTLLGFGSGSPVTSENYTTGEFTSFRGRIMAVIRSGYDAGDITFTVDAAGKENLKASCTISVR